jgi:DNA polymerase alpha subunit A
LPDVEWYIGKQIFPPVERLCANIVGTSTSQLAEQLGLDIRKYNSFQTQQNSNDDIEIHPLESQIPDEVRFADCQRLSLRCRKCKTSSPFEGLLGSSDRVSASGITCPSCTTLIPTLSIVAQLEHAIRTETTRYYEAWLVCDDTQCGNRTRQMSVYGTRCLGPKGLASGCLGRMRYEYTEKAIYNNLVYFASLFDVDRAKDKAGEQGGAEKDKVLALAEHNRVRFGTCKGVVDKYLEKCGRQWVAMDTLFAKLGFNKMLAAAA